MTTSAALEAQFVTHVFNDATLQSTYSPRLIKYAIDDQSEAEIESMTYQRKINYFQLLIERDVLQNGVNMRDYQFRIRIGYYVEKTDDNAEWTLVRNGMERVSDLLISTFYPAVNIIDILEFADGIQISPAIRGGVLCWGAELPLRAIVGI